MKAEDVLRLDAPKKNLLVVGDGLTDVYVHGRLEQSQDGCQKFVETYKVGCEGGAANAAESTKRSGSECWADVPYFEEKTRFISEGRIVFRHDSAWGKIHRDDLDGRRRGTLNTIRNGTHDAVYLADYDKGFITDAFMQQIVAECIQRGIPCVVDPKRDPSNCLGAVLKCNDVYHAKHNRDMTGDYVVTQGELEPCVSGTIHYDGKMLTLPGRTYQSQVVCRNHVGAGDCFGAWLTLGLAHGLELVEAARLAHAAGRVYVQFSHNRPPWPHEIRKELDPVGGKVLSGGETAALRQSCTGRIVFANGCWRWPHAGHSWFLQWAKQQGDILVVGVNDDLSTFRNKPGEFCLQLEQRLQLIASHGVVDFVVPFGQDTPIEVIRLLKPDVICKAHDYTDKDVCGSDVCEVRIAPPSPFPDHVSDIIRAVRGDF